MGEGHVKEHDIKVRRNGPGRLPMWPNEIERFVDRTMRGFVSWPRLDPWHHRTTFWQKDWFPSIDVFEREGNMVLRADLPGMKREDIDVAVEDDVLVLQGHRHEEKEIKEEDYRRSERATGVFCRAIKLPEGVYADSIEATYTDGVLEVTIPFPATPEPKRLKVEVK